MRRLTLSSRTAHPAFFDMSTRLKPPGVKAGIFRIGDRAAAHVWLGDWRRRNPEHKLVVVDNPHLPGCEDSRYLPAEWLFAGIADEIWEAEHAADALPRPEGVHIYHVSMWRIWRWLRANNGFKPTLQPTPASIERVGRWVSLRGPYLTVQPLFDASYDIYRNRPPAWWGAIIAQLVAAGVMVVVLGHPRNAARLPLPQGVRAAWTAGFNPMESLALIDRAAAHLGGQTGTTLWASILRTPVIAAYMGWAGHPKKTIDNRPIEFGAPVIPVDLMGAPEDIARRTLEVYHGVTGGSA